MYLIPMYNFILYIEIILTTIRATFKLLNLCTMYIDTPDYSGEIGKVGVCITKSFLGQRKGELKVFV